MTSFDLTGIGRLTERFIKGNDRLAYEVTKLEEDERHVLFQASNLFSLLYCQVTTDLGLISRWEHFQGELYKRDGSKANRYLVFIVPDLLIKQSSLYEELTRAERDDRFFRKVFIGIPESVKQGDVEGLLAERIPLWFEDRSEVIRQYVPVLTDVVTDRDLLQLLSQKPPSTVVKTIEADSRFHYLFLERGQPSTARASGLSETAQIGARPMRGPRITSLTLREFRRFQQTTIDFDADVVVVYGRNGTGKTTLCDALELSLFPELCRLRRDPDITPGEGHTNDPFLRAGTQSDCANIRIEGRADSIPFVLDTIVKPEATEQALNGRHASQTEVIRFLTRNDEVEKDGFHDILLHTHFLGQHSIRDFIYGSRWEENDKITTKRYNLLAEMFGFGAVEQLKRRLTGVLAQLKRKVTEAEDHIRAVNVQIRGLKHKYGPKCRQDLEQRGHQLSPTGAVAEYRNLLQRLLPLLGAEAADRFAFTDQRPMEEYLNTCEAMRSILSSEAERSESRAADLRRLGRLVTKLCAVFPDVSLPETATIAACIVQVRERSIAAAAVAEKARRDIRAIAGTADRVEKQIEIISRFLKGFERYKELQRMQTEATEVLSGIERKRSELLQRQGVLIGELKRVMADEETVAKRLVVAQERMRAYEQLLASLADVRTAAIILSQNADREAALDAVIAETQQKLAQPSELESPGPSTHTESPALDLEALRAEEGYTCPCCGAKYQDRRGLEQGIQGQLQESKYGRELRAFLTYLENQNAEAKRSRLLETIRSLSQEKATIEKSSRSCEKTLASFTAIATTAGIPSIPPEDDLRQRMREEQSRIDGARQELDNHRAKSIRNQLESVQAELATLTGDYLATHLGEIRGVVAELTGAVADIMPITEVENRSAVEARLSQLTTEAGELARRRERLLADVGLQGGGEEMEREIDRTIGELESLLMKQETLRKETIGRATGLGVEALDRQRSCFEMSRAVEDLSRVFGVLSAQERSDTLRNALTSHDSDRRRWDACHKAIDRINSDLSKLSYSGLQESLGQYGPLINRVYQKFIRHDIFAALVLQPHSSKKARKRDLYLRLRSYSGEMEYTPASYLSEAQLNILALSIFLTRVMYQNISALETVFIDDPIQQMDDMNAAAFVDVVLGLSSMGRQIIITTCNHDFYRLVTHKMRGVTSASFKAVNLDLQRPDFTGKPPPRKA